ncbi:unnamed protein product [Ixodes pacificus]
MAPCSKETNNLSLVRLHSRFRMAAAHLVSIPAWRNRHMFRKISSFPNSGLGQKSTMLRFTYCMQLYSVAPYDGQQQTQLPNPANPALQLYHVTMRPAGHTKLAWIGLASMARSVLRNSS